MPKKDLPTYKFADKIAQVNINPQNVEQHIHLSQETPKVLNERIEPDVKKLLDSLKERYQRRYEQRLDGRFEITLEVSESFGGQNLQAINEQYDINASAGVAIEVIREAFRKAGRLLIVGNPGVGKTVLLLKLANDLLKEVNLEKQEAMPVIFNLASWSPEYEKFEDWLIAMLNSGNGLSKDFAATLLHAGRIIFLLDGLDELARNESEELAAKKRADCLKSLNEREFGIRMGGESQIS